MISLYDLYFLLLLILHVVSYFIGARASIFMYIKYLFSGLSFDLTAHIFRIVATKEYGKEMYSTGRLFYFLLLKGALVYVD
jgi:hypothetical protein